MEFKNPSCDTSRAPVSMQGSICTLRTIPRRR